MLPTSSRFLFYELEQRGNATKGDRKGWPPNAQDITVELTHMREDELVPWAWIADETRTVSEWNTAASVLDYVRDRVAEAALNPWGVPPPLILTESKGVAGVLRGVAGEYSCPIAGTGGQCAGFLWTGVAPLLVGNRRRVLYLGDLDKAGDDIECNTRDTLEHAAGRDVYWHRIGLYKEQLPPGTVAIRKLDRRSDPPVETLAWEVEAMGQAAVVALLRDTLDGMLPEGLDQVRIRADMQRADVIARLA